MPDMSAAQLVAFMIDQLNWDEGLFSIHRQSGAGGRLFHLPPNWCGRVSLRRLLDDSKVSASEELSSQTWMFAPVQSRAREVAPCSLHKFFACAQDLKLTYLYHKDNADAWIAGLRPADEPRLFSLFYNARLRPGPAPAVKLDKHDWLLLRDHIFAGGLTLNPLLGRYSCGRWSFDLWTGIPAVNLYGRSAPALSTKPLRIRCDETPNGRLMIETEPADRCPLSDDDGTLKEPC